MTSADLRALHRRWLDELWAGQLDAARDLVADDFVGHWPGRTVHGPEELTAVVAETRAMSTSITRRRAPARGEISRPRALDDLPAWLLGR